MPKKKVVLNEEPEMPIENEEDSNEQKLEDLVVDDFFYATADGSSDPHAWVVDEEGIPMEELEGIGAAGYVPRLTAPSASDKNWIKTTYGGYNYCINIANGSCLPNCVGYAWGRWREILGGYHNLSRGNAENWYPNTGDGYERGQTPRLGAVICWRKGQIYNGNDGAGHVAIVEEIYDDGSILTSNSAYGGTRFYMKKIYPPYNFSSAYTFQGFIYNPAVVDEVPSDSENEYVQQDEYEIGDKVLINGPLYRSSTATSASGSVSNKQTIITRKAKGAAHPYNTTGDLGWMSTASIKKIVPKKQEEEVKPEPAPAPQPEPTPAPTPEPEPTPAPEPVFKFNIGDKVVINGPLYRNSTADKAAGSISNKITYITRRVNAKHPYNTTGDLGWMDEASIKAYVEPAVDTTIRRGDKVKVLKAVTYTGGTFKTWYKVYDVIEVSGDRIVIGIGRTVTAAVHRSNLQKV